MKRLTSGALAGAIGLGLLLASSDTATAQSRTPVQRIHPETSATTPQAPPGGAYQKVSALVPLPDFIPGMGTLYVDPATLPAGPFLGYDHQGNLVNSIYMIPLKDLNAQKAFSRLKVAQERVDHVDIAFNAGHPGVAEPHYHVTLWYVTPERAAELGK
jgi:hypothetical protein